MSFQDVGVGGTKRARPPLRGAAKLESYKVMPAVPEGGGSTGVGAGNSPAAADSGVGSAYARVSDGIAQYRKNISILEGIVSRFGSKDDGPVLQKQYATQLDVVRALGKRIESQLLSAEEGMRTMDRAERDRSRATHAKLDRDYRSVERAFKNVQLEVGKKLNAAEARRKVAEEEAERRRRMREEGEGDGGRAEEEEQLLQMQLQEERFAEQIMREREEEIRNINKNMHTVNEIFKDLAHIVDSQQEQIDAVETHMENAKDNTEAGLKQVEKANEKADSPYQCVMS